MLCCSTGYAMDDSSTWHAVFISQLDMGMLVHCAVMREITKYPNCHSANMANIITYLTDTKLVNSKRNEPYRQVFFVLSCTGYLTRWRHGDFLGCTDGTSWYNNFAIAASATIRCSSNCYWHERPPGNKNRNSGIWKLLRTIHQLVQHSQSGWKNFARMWSSNCLFGTAERERIRILLQMNARHCGWKHTTSPEWILRSRQRLVHRQEYWLQEDERITLRFARWMIASLEQHNVQSFSEQNAEYS